MHKHNDLHNNDPPLEDKVLGSPEVGILHRFSQIKENKKVKSPKLCLKHFIQKQTSFNNVWTALLKSESIGACSLKISISDPHRKYMLKTSLSEKNLDLLEVCSSKAQSSDCINRLVTVDSNPKLFNYSCFMEPNRKVTLLRGSPCCPYGSYKKQAAVEFVSPFSVCSEESMGAKSPIDHKVDAEMEGVDLNSLFGDDDAPPSVAPGPPLSLYQKCRRTWFPLSNIVELF